MRSCTILAAMACLAAAAHADQLVNGGFETMPNFGTGPAGDSGYSLLTGSAIPGWTIEPGYGATIHNTVLYPTIAGLFSLNTDAEGFNNHNINMFQDFAASNGTAYELTFDWANWFTNSVVLHVSVQDTVTNAFLTQGFYGVAPGLHNETLAFNGTGNTLRLRIDHSPENGFNDNTFIVDNFSVNAVPAPASAVGLALGGLLLRRRR